MTDTTYIYGLKDPRDEKIRYIGKTSHPKERLGHHIQVKYNNHKSNWIQSLLQIGLTPSMEIIDEVPISEWEFWEKHYMKLFKSFGADLVNSTEGGRGGKDNHNPSELTRERMRIAQLGKKHTEESKKKMSENRKGIIVSDETRKKLSEVGKGRKMSAESIAKTASANRGRKNTQEVKDRISQKLKGRKIPQDVLIRRAKSQMKPILQFDIDNNFIKEWNSAKDAKLELNPANHGLSDVLKGKRKTWQGFKWEYKM